MKFSILTPTLNEEKYIGKLLGALKKQTHKDFEVIILDGKSEDDTLGTLKKNSKGLNVRVSVSKERGVCAQRNKAAAESKTENLVFLDADVIPGPDFLEKIAKKITERKLDCATCWNVPISKNPYDHAIYNMFNFIFLSAMEKIKPSAIGTFIYASKKAFNSVNGFDEEVLWGEDTDLVRRIVKKGYKFGVFFEPKIYFSNRRLEQEGRLAFTIKCMKAGIYGFYKPVKKNIIKYEFGKHR